MNFARVVDKPVNIMYMHSWGDNRTAVDCTMIFDPANKVSVNHAVGSRACRVKYAYAHGELRNTVFEPCYDSGKNAWDFALTRKLEGGNAVKGTYNCSSKLLGLEWSRDSKTDGTFKVILISLSFCSLTSLFIPNLKPFMELLLAFYWK
jgi:hypothetical protein